MAVYKITVSSPVNIVKIRDDLKSAGDTIANVTMHYDVQNNEAEVLVESDLDEATVTDIVNNAKMTVDEYKASIS